jgi:hypothetical protein
MAPFLPPGRACEAGKELCQILPSTLIFGHEHNEHLSA